MKKFPYANLHGTPCYFDEKGKEIAEFNLKGRSAVLDFHKKYPNAYIYLTPQMILPKQGINFILEYFQNEARCSL